MRCKLFDLAAFGNLEQIFVSDRKNIEGVLATRPYVRQSVFLDATNCGEMFNNWNESKHDMLLSEVLINCNPPWGNTFIYGGKFVLANGVIELGVHAIVADEEIVQEFKRVREGEGVSVDNFDGVITLGVWQRVTSENRVSCTPYVFLTQGGKHVGVMEDGQSWSDKERYGALYSFAPFVFQLSHCKNIITKEHDPYRPMMPRGKRNKAPKIKYHTLEISDTLIKRDGGESLGDGDMPKHICRGNFAHYTEERPLFGKYTGTFWRPMHIKGNARHGIVGKEYSL